MLSTQSLREQMDRYANGAVSADALEEWLAAESWDMRRWAPPGLQHLVEAIQAAFIDYSDRRISEEELREILLQRRSQLHKAREATEQLEASAASLAEVIKVGQKKESIAGSQALIFQFEAAVA